MSPSPASSRDDGVTAGDREETRAMAFATFGTLGIMTALEIFLTAVVLTQR